MSRRRPDVDDAAGAAVSADLLVTLRAGAPTTLTDVSALLRCEFRCALSVPGSRVGDVPTYTTSLAQATGLASRWAAGLVDPTAPGRPPYGARITVTATALAYPGTPPVVVLDLTLTRRRASPTGPLAPAWVETEGGRRT